MAEMTITKIVVTVGVTRSLGPYEFARVDISNEARVDVAPGSAEYRKAHRELVENVQAMVEKAEANMLGEKK